MLDCSLALSGRLMVQSSLGLQQRSEMGGGYWPSLEVLRGVVLSGERVSSQQWQVSGCLRSIGWCAEYRK